MIGDGDCGEIGGMKIAKETEVLLGEYLPPRHFVHHKYHMNPDRRGGKPATNRLSYGAASSTELS
jgi:hypothetical protein